MQGARKGARKIVGHHLPPATSSLKQSCSIWTVMGANLVGHRLLHVRKSRALYYTFGLIRK